MAVIREQRQFRIGPIGVARASQGGQIVGEAIANSANQLAEIFFKEGAMRAEKAGLEAGASAAPEQVVTINPNTGQPEAYSPPKEFGSIATEAYQRVVLRRFQQSIDDEMQAKAKELAVKYENNANAVALYESSMSDYIASMSNAAEGQFKGYIQDVGTAYLQATRSNLAVAQIRRERAAAANAQANSILKGASDLQEMIAQLGPDALTGPTAAAGIAASLGVSLDDAEKAVLFDGSVSSSLRRAVAVAPVQGLIAYAARNAKDPESLNLLRYALGSQDIGAIPPEFAYVRDAVSQFAGNQEVLADLEKFSDGLLGDKVEFLKIEQDRQARIESARLAQLSFSLGANTPAMAAQYLQSAFTQPANVTAAMINNEWRRASSDISVAIAAGQNDYAKALTESRDALFKASVKGLYLRALDGLSDKDMKPLSAAILNRNPAIAPASSQDELIALFKLEENDLKIWDDFTSIINTYGEKGGKHFALLNEMQAAAALDNLSLPISGVDFARGTNISSSVNAIIKQINGISNLDDQLRETRIKDAQLGGARAFINEFFETSPTADQVNDANSFLGGGSYSVLTPAQVELLSSARIFRDDSGRISELRTHFNNQSNVFFERQQSDRKRSEEANTIRAILNGQGDPANVNQRELLEKYLQQNFGPAFGNRPLASLWNDPAALSNPRMAPMLDFMRTTNVLPESLHDAFTSAARGGFAGGNVSAVVSLYSNLRNYEYAGQVIRNPSLLALSEAQVATLDYIADALPVVGSSPAAIAQMFELRAQLERDPLFKQRIETTFEMKMEEVVMGLDGIESVPASAYNALLAAGLEIFKIASPQGASASDMIDRLQAQLDRTYVDGGGVVFDASGNRRTNAAISFAAPGNEAEFRGYMATLAREALGDKVKFVQFDTTGSLMRSILGGLEPSDQLAVIYSNPIGIPGAGGNYSYVLKQRTRDGFDEVITKPIQISDDAGKPITVFVPLIVSNNDPRFRRIVDEKVRQSVAAAEEAIAREKALTIPVMP
jgi:hypothetical protein